MVFEKRELKKILNEYFKKARQYEPGLLTSMDLVVTTERMGGIVQCPEDDIWRRTILPINGSTVVIDYFVDSNGNHNGFKIEIPSKISLDTAKEKFEELTENAYIALEERYKAQQKNDFNRHNELLDARFREIRYNICHQ